jgi:hypothetical protein
MSWNCPNCGTKDNPPNVSVCHGMCGYTRYGRLVLVSTETNKEARFNIDASIGRGLLAKLVGDGGRFASEEQFLLKRCPDQSSWVIVPSAKAINDTQVNGVVIEASGTKLVDGSRVTIGPDTMPLVVRFEYD